jgi:hypothetical protein
MTKSIALKEAEIAHPILSKVMYIAIITEVIVLCTYIAMSIEKENYNGIPFAIVLLNALNLGWDTIWYFWKPKK